jgi:hypothetical protein
VTSTNELETSTALLLMLELCISRLDLAELDSAQEEVGGKATLVSTLFKPHDSHVSILPPPPLQYKSPSAPTP